MKYCLKGIHPGLLLLLLSAVISARSQTAAAVSGKIIDSVSGAILPFAQLALGNSTLGTVSNEDGRFFLQVPALHANDTLYIMYLGYERAGLAVSGMFNRENLIRLKPKEVTLKEVEVLALSPQEVLRRTFNRISENYGSDSVLLTAFYRSQKFAGKKLAEYAEAVIEDMKAGYFTQNSFNDNKEALKHSNSTRLVKGRVVSDTALVNSLGDVGRMAGCLGCIFMTDPAENNFRTVLDEEVFRFYSLKMEEIANPEGGKIYHIWFDQLKKNIRGFKGELFIDGSSFALMKMKQSPSFNAFDQYEKDKYKKTYVINNTGGWIAEMPLINRTVVYSRRDGKWCLSIVHDEQWVMFTQPLNGQKIRMGYKNDLVVTDVSRDVSVLRSYKGDKKAGASQRWDQLAGLADEAFWAKFNYLPVEESLRSAIQGIGK